MAVYTEDLLQRTGTYQADKHSAVKAVVLLRNALCAHCKEIAKELLYIICKVIHATSRLFMQLPRCGNCSRNIYSHFNVTLRLWDNKTVRRRGETTNFGMALSPPSDLTQLATRLPSSTLQQKEYQLLWKC